MNATAREHDVDWLTPALLWGTEGVKLRAPAVVRLDGDDFMDAFAKLLAPKPDRAALWDKRAGVGDETKKAGVLYQPIHGCYALACASLTCRDAGRPEKAVAPARGDSVGFVLRRLDANGAELAWVPSGNGEGAWQSPKGVLPADGEEVIPMFPVPLAGPTPRRVWAGLVPTASRETYQPGTPPPKPREPSPEKVRLIAELEDGPLTALAAPAGAPPQNILVTLQAALALAEFVNAHTLSPASPLKDDVPKLLDTTDLGQALKNVGFGLAAAMEKAWKEQDYLLGTAEHPKDPPLGTAGLALPLPEPQRNSVRDAIVGALLPPAKPLAAPRGVVLPKFGTDPAQQYVIHCVYLRTHCPPVVSEPSEVFTVAPVHDPDAPARTIRIPMPDIGIGSLRRFKKNVGFILSAALRGKVKSLSGKKLQDIDDGNVSDGPPEEGGEICTFAIPIIMLCAMIVLFIFLVLLNIVFFWLPLLKICLPLPKGKP